MSYEPITDIISTPNSIQTWVHITLANAHTFFVGEDGVLVHNERWCGTYKEINKGESWAKKVFDRITGGDYTQRGKTLVGKTKDGRDVNLHYSSSKHTKDKAKIEIGNGPTDPNSVKHRYIK